MALTITIPGGKAQLAGSNIWMKVNTDAVQGSLYQILLKATPENDRIPGGPFLEAITPDANGDVWFELSNLFWRKLVPAFSYGNNQLHIEHEELLETVDIDIGESYVDEQNVRQELWAELEGDQYKIKILNGELTQQKQNELNEAGTTFYSEFIQGGKFLTSLVNGTTIFPGQNVKLWWLTSATEQQVLSAKADYTLQDETTGTISSDITINPDKSNEFNVDPVTLGLPSDAANPVVSYYFYLADGATLKSEQFTFEVNNDYQEHLTTLFSLNKYGVVDCYGLTGTPAYSKSVERSYGQRMSQPNDTTRQATRVSTSKSGQLIREQSTGYKSLDEIMAMEDLLMSDQLWIPHGSMLLPVTIENSDELLADLMDSVHELTLKLTEAH